MSIPDYTRYTPLTRAWLIGTEIGAHIKTIENYLVDSGYTDRTISGYLSCIADFAHWFTKQPVRLTELSEDHINAFLIQHLPTCHCAPRCRRTPTEIRAAIHLLIQQFRLNGHCIPQHVQNLPKFSLELADFDRYLTEVCGLSSAARLPRLRQVRDFLWHILKVSRYNSNRSIQNR